MALLHELDGFQDQTKIMLRSTLDALFGFSKQSHLTRSSGSGVEIHCFLSRQFGLQTFAGSGFSLFLFLLHPGGGRPSSVGIKYGVSTVTASSPCVNFPNVPLRTFICGQIFMPSPGCEKVYSSTPNINRTVNISGSIHLRDDGDS